MPKDNQTSRQNRGPINIGNAVLAMAYSFDPTGTLKRVMQMFNDGTIIVPDDISKDVAMGAFPADVLISTRHLLRGLETDGTWALRWHGDVASAAVDIGKHVSFSELGINAGIAYDDIGATRITYNEIQALKNDEDFMDALKSSGNIPMTKRTTLVLHDATGLSSTEKLNKGYNFEITNSAGHTVNICRNSISWMEIDGYNGDFLMGFLIEDSIAVLARRVRKAGEETYKFRSISITSLAQVLKATKVKQLIAAWKKAEAKLPDNKVHRVQFGAAGHRTDAFPSATTDKLQATG